MSEIITIIPNIKQRQDFPNIGLQDVIDILDHFGFIVEIRLTKKDVEVKK